MKPDDRFSQQLYANENRTSSSHKDTNSQASVKKADAPEINFGTVSHFYKEVYADAECDTPKSQ